MLQKLKLVFFSQYRIIGKILRWNSHPDYVTLWIDCSPYSIAGWCGAWIRDVFCTLILPLFFRGTSPPPQLHIYWNDFGEAKQKKILFCFYKPEQILDDIGKYFFHVLMADSKQRSRDWGRVISLWLRVQTLKSDLGFNSGSALHTWNLDAWFNFPKVYNNCSQMDH